MIFSATNSPEARKEKAPLHILEKGFELLYYRLIMNESYSMRSTEELERAGC